MLNTKGQRKCKCKHAAERDLKPDEASPMWRIGVILCAITVCSVDRRVVSFMFSFLCAAVVYKVVCSMDSQSSQGDSQFADSRKWDISWCGRQRTTFHVMMGFSRRLRQDAAKNRGLWIQDFQMVDSVDRQY